MNLMHNFEAFFMLKGKRKEKQNLTKIYQTGKNILTK